MDRKTFSQPFNPVIKTGESIIDTKLNQTLNNLIFLAENGYLDQLNDLLKEHSLKVEK